MIMRPSLLLARSFATAFAFAPPPLRFAGDARLKAEPRDEAAAPLADVVKLPDRFRLESPDGWEFPLEEGRRLVCIGDVHGDCEALKGCLMVAGVYEEAEESDEFGEASEITEFHGRWVGGNTIVVQTGDVLDRGNEELACFLLLAKMSREAEEAGGAVIVLHGNHEIFNAEIDLYFAPEDRDDHGKILCPIINEAVGSDNWKIQYGRTDQCRKAAYEPGGLLAEPIMSKLKVAVKVGKTVCVHGGLGEKMLDEFGGIDTMNEMVSKWIMGFKVRDEGKDDPIGHFAYQNNSGNFKDETEREYSVRDRENTIRKTTPLFALERGGRSPLFDRRFSYYDTCNVDATADLIKGLRRLEAARLVVGHTPQGEINSIIGEKVWRIDVGVSRWMHRRTPQVLQVKNEGGKEVVSVLKADQDSDCE